MSTRSCIAIATGDGWEGVYCHSDGYPTWQGPQLWQTLSIYKANLLAFEADILTAHPCGYSSFPDDCFCHTYDDDHSPMPITAADEAVNEAFHVPWVYVVGRRVLTIFHSVPTGEERRVEGHHGRWWMEPCYRWQLVTQVPLDGPEPPWSAIEADGHRLAAMARIP